MMLHGWGFWPRGGLLALLFLFVLIGGIVGLVAFLVRPSRQGPPQPPPPPSPPDPALQILRERFARGEIDQAEFDERRRALGG